MDVNDNTRPPEYPVGSVIHPPDDVRDPLNSRGDDVSYDVVGHHADGEPIVRVNYLYHVGSPVRLDSIIPSRRPPRGQ